MTNNETTRFEYRAVFANPYSDYIEYSAPVDDPKKIPTHAPRSEETHGYVSGVQVRIVTAWSDPVKPEEIGR